MATADRSRRDLALSVSGCVLGAGVAFLASRHTWAVRVTPRQPPLSPLREVFAGSEFVAWLPAVAVVGMAAGLALLATCGAGRLLVAGVAVASGLGIATASGYGLTLVSDSGRAVVDGGLWPLICLAAGLVVTLAGLRAIHRGRHWPGMGGRYDRAGGRAGAPVAERRDPAELWDALDTGGDPTDDTPRG